MAEEIAVKVGFFTKLLDFLFGRDASIRRGKRRALRVIQRQLNKTGFKYVNEKKDFVSSSFADFLYDVYKSIAHLREMFLKDTNDEYFVNQIMNFSLTEEQSKIIESLDPESIRKLSAETELKELATKGMNSFVKLRDSLSSEEQLSINSLYNSVTALKQFCILDYYAALRKFGTHFKENSFEVHPKFNNAVMGYVHDFLLDFFNCISLILKVNTWQETFEFLKKLWSLDNTEVEKVLSLISFINELDSKKVFSYMIKLVNRDPSSEVNYEVSGKNIIRPYMDNIYQEFRSTVEDIQKARISAQRKKMVEDVFEGRELIRLKFYTEAENEAFVQAKVKQYSHCNALLYLNSFLEIFFEGEILPFLSHFEVIAICPRANYVTSFSSICHDIAEQKSAVFEFDRKLDTKFAEGYKLKSLLSRVTVNESVAINFNMEMDGINSNAESLINRILKQLQEAFTYYEELLHERRLNRHDIITNWSDIDKKFEGGCLPLLQKTHSHIKAFLTLMKNYNQLY